MPSLDLLSIGSAAGAGGSSTRVGNIGEWFAPAPKVVAVSGLVTASISGAMPDGQYYPDPDERSTNVLLYATSENQWRYYAGSSLRWSVSNFHNVSGNNGMASTQQVPWFATVGGTRYIYIQLGRTSDWKRAIMRINIATGAVSYGPVWDGMEGTGNHASLGASYNATIMNLNGTTRLVHDGGGGSTIWSLNLSTMTKGSQVYSASGATSTGWVHNKYFVLNAMNGIHKDIYHNNASGNGPGTTRTLWRLSNIGENANNIVGTNLRWTHADYCTVDMANKPSTIAYGGLSLSRSDLVSFIDYLYEPYGLKLSALPQTY